jgi:hypothetical protein
VTRYSSATRPSRFVLTQRVRRRQFVVASTGFAAHVIIQNMTDRRALLALSLALSSCATTAGRDWLNTPIDQRAEPVTIGAIQPETAAESRPRLSHTVTLGESYYASESTAAAPGAAPAVQVNVSTPVVVNNYGGYGYGYGYYSPSYGAGPIGAPIRATRSTATKVGSDFPAPPDYGPRALK